jgi:hypothetical protein
MGRTRKIPPRNRIPVYHANLMSLPVQFVYERTNFITSYTSISLATRTSARLMTAAAPAVVQRPYLPKRATQPTLCAETQTHYSEFKRPFSFIYECVRACLCVCVFELECDCTECIRKAVEAVVCFKAPIKTQQTTMFYTKQSYPFKEGNIMYDAALNGSLWITEKVNPLTSETRLT